MTTLLLVSMVCAVCCVSACAVPTAPTAAQEMLTVPLTVRVFRYGSSVPLPAVVQVEVAGRIASWRQADDSGSVVVDVPYGQPVTLYANATGYQTASASATVTGREERWTFYLFPAE